MTPAEKRQVWQYIKQYSPEQESFIHALRETFGVIELVSFKQIKNPQQEGSGSSNQTVLPDTSKGIFADG